MSNPKKIGVVLSGAGVYDGSEIHEAVITLLALDRAQAEIIMMAPDVPQMHVINHLSGNPIPGENRNVLQEAARIARGKIQDIAKITAQKLDGLIFIGGFGAAKNLCDFAVKSADCTVIPEVDRIINEMHVAGKPIGFICITPVIAAKVLGAHHPELTIGNDPETAAAIKAMGGVPVERPVNEIAYDQKNNVVSAPAYMYNARIADVAKGIEKLVAKVVELA